MKSQAQQDFSLSWQNISVEVDIKNSSFWRTTITKKTVLHDVSGSAKSNSLVAIMGSSGCGKTTLLSAISGRKSNKTGVLKINGKTLSDDDICKISAYMHQDDIFTEFLTTYEHLKFVAALQLSDKSEQTREDNIRKLLSELSLEHQTTTLVKNLSGGQRRRLSLAGKLITNPYILFCDEPTTGLDSFSAIVVIQKLRQIAMGGKMVLASIHQPSSDLFHCFDNITLLAEGKLVFQGTIDDAKSFFESMNLECPFNYNLADFYMNCLTEQNVDKLCAMYASRKRANEPETVNSINLESFRKPYNSFFAELKWLLWRCLIDIWRNKFAHIWAYFVVMCEYFIVGLIYAQVSVTDNDSAQSIEGFFSYLASGITYTNMYAVINVFPGEVGVFMSEKELYSTHSYFVSKFISLIPMVLLSTLTYTTLLFVILKFLQGFILWVEMTIVLCLVGMVSSCLGLAFSATFSSVEAVDLYMGPTEFLLFLLSGLMIKLDTVPLAIRWIKYLSPFYYGFDLMSNLFWLPVTNLGNCPTDKLIPCYNNGSEILEKYGVYKTYASLSFDILYIFVLMTIFCLIGFAGIWRKKMLYTM